MSENSIQEVGCKSSAVIGCWSRTVPIREPLVQGEAVVYLCVCLHVCVIRISAGIIRLGRDLTETYILIIVMCEMCLKPSQMADYQMDYKHQPHFVISFFLGGGPLYS